MHSVEQLASSDYFSREQTTFIEPHLINVLKDMAFEVSKRKFKNSVGQMFSIESALVKKALLKWFNAKFRRQFDKINSVQKLKYEGQNPIN